MNRKEALYALVDGKKVSFKLQHYAYEFTMRPDGGIYGDDMPGTSRCLPVKDGYEIVEDPNPHTKGSFEWAKEENRRGKPVKSNEEDCSYTYGPGELANKGTLVYVAEMLSTNWEVV